MLKRKHWFEYIIKEEYVYERRGSCYQHGGVERREYETFFSCKKGKRTIEHHSL